METAALGDEAPVLLPATVGFTRPAADWAQSAPALSQPHAPIRGRLGGYLVEKGLLAPETLRVALMEQTVTKQRLGQILVANDMVTRRVLIDALIELDPTSLATEFVNRCPIPPELLRQHQIIVIAETDEAVYVSTGGPEDVARFVVEDHYPGMEIEFADYIAANQDAFVEQIARNSSLLNQRREEDMLDGLLFDAITTAASDIHIEPKRLSYSVLFRRLGRREVVYEGNPGEYDKLVTLIKTRAALDIAERQRPQSGSFNMPFQGKFIDFRVECLPIKSANSREKVVIRVLDTERINPVLGKLGITRLDQWRRAYDQPNGIVIVSGPTGSGKSTTLHATERELDRLDLAVYSVEDPVEYQLPFISQVQVNLDKGMDFKNAIRSFLRMDPDVIILGEVRDEETARMAVRAAETGHMVFITLHATDVRGVFSRMEDLGVSKTNLKGLCRGVMVQSLVRTLCTKCGGSGCHHCHDSGYAGRTVVSECVAFSDDREIERAIEGQVWWPRQIDDAIGKTVSGVTDVAEVRRYFGAQVDIWEERHGPVPPRGGAMPAMLAAPEGASGRTEP
ncbi:hypothetical protein BHAOGJBA_1142 [Methylobacterium hispanicum]|uniref:Bacterial type II secretion system protein E domain-containing protein n=1 Tax=Methylobacterium hispanicum TaxID=270350 RepID=A0AAV4ZGY0_9HYPH|nr:GspE/PulE family protein [Methylobacterium hispanicum]GJD87637.1 hypothetical protein BHAOGJBA_1142 [Methylobacterium hispanicum]